MTPIEQAKRRKKLLGWQTSKRTDRMIRYLLAFLCGVVAFTLTFVDRENDNGGDNSGISTAPALMQ